MWEMETPLSLIGFNGARSIDRDERKGQTGRAMSARTLQWGPVD